MIKFIPFHENHNNGNFGSFMENRFAIIEKKIAEALNSKDIQFKCNKPECQGIDSEVLVFLDANSDSKHTYIVDNYCCENFNERLITFLSPAGNFDQF